VFVWERVVGDRVEALKWGWVEVVNRNGMFVFRDDRGTVHWYKGGLTRLYLKGEVKLARCKELFCRAFSWFGPEDLKKYLDVPLREESKHWVFDLGAPVPRFQILNFERSHGIKVYSDASHSTCIEVEESTPFWISEFNKSISDFGKLHEQFGENLKVHLRLIQLWEKEARGFRVKSKIRRIKEQPNQRNLFDWMV